MLAMSVLAFSATAENALENVERRTAEILKIDRSQVGEWVREKGWIAVVGIAAMENKTPAEIIGKRHELAEIAIMDAKLKLAEKLGFSLSAEEKRHLWGVSDADKDVAGITTTSRVQFLAKHRILGASVLLQSESNLDGEYLMAVSLVWSKGLQKSAAELMSGRGVKSASVPGKYTLKEWLKEKIDPALVVGPRQYVDNKGKRHFIGIVSMPCDKAVPPRQMLTLERVLQIKGKATVAWSLRSDVETSSVSSTMLKQTSVNGKEDAEVTSELTQRIRQRLRSAVPPVRPLFGDTCIIREHPLFPGSKMVIYACELDGEFEEYKFE
jgi:hypothetical protein